MKKLLATNLRISMLELSLFFFSDFLDRGTHIKVNPFPTLKICFLNIKFEKCTTC